MAKKSALAAFGGGVHHWSFFQQAHPSFVSINVKEFSNILIELRDINGEFLEFSPSFKTIITLKVRSSSLYKESN